MEGQCVYNFVRGERCIFNKLLNYIEHLLAKIKATFTSQKNLNSLIEDRNRNLLENLATDQRFYRLSNNSFVQIKTAMFA